MRKALFHFAHSVLYKVECALDAVFMFSPRDWYLDKKAQRVYRRVLESIPADPPYRWELEPDADVDPEGLDALTNKYMEPEMLALEKTLQQV